MFDGFFPGEEEDAAGATTSVYQRKPKNCAADLELPSHHRENRQFAGLKNQGATCYLNSLLQSLYMIPEFRNAILKLPLCEGDNSEKRTDLVPEAKKFRFLFELQKLFSELKLLSDISISTKSTTDAFGWHDNEQLVQQDVQEAYRIIFDAIERALFGTVYGETITNGFKGTIVNLLECLSCGNVREREEPFYDLMLQVKDMQNVEESLLNMLTMERLEGDNQYFCDICQKKVDALKGIKVRKYPEVVTFVLNRFDFDYNTFTRVKVNSKFTFNMEIDMSLYAERPEDFPSEDDCTYELSAILIHIGSAVSGHYKAYIRDTMNEGDWEGVMKRYSAAKTSEAKQPEKQEQERNDDSKEQLLQSKEIEVQENSKVSSDSVTATKVKGNKNKDKQDKREQKGKNKGKGKDKQNNRAADDDDENFPYKFKNKQLESGWFEFNDASVTAIPFTRIQKQFGGSNENAYILFYRKKALESDPNFKLEEIPLYLQKHIKQANNKAAQEREEYAEAEMNIECTFYDKSKINFESKTHQEGYEPQAHGTTLKLRIDSKLEDLFTRVSKALPGLNLDEDKLVLVQSQQLGNGHIHFVREFRSDIKELTIEEVGLEHTSTFVVFATESDENYQAIADKIGEDAVPIRVNIRYMGSDFNILVHQKDTLKSLRLKIQNVTGVSFDQQYITQIRDGQQPVFLNSSEDTDEKTLALLKFNDSDDLIIDEIDEATLKAKMYKQVEQKDSPGIQEDSHKEKGEPDEILSTHANNLTTVLVESDDRNGVVRYYVDLDWTLRALIESIKRKLDIDQTSSRRLRKLNGNALFYEEELEQTLRDLQFEEGGIRLGLEFGKFPTYGNLTLKIKVQSKHLKEDAKTEDEFICFPTETIEELKKKVCEAFKIDPNEHKVYKTDWLESPVQLITKETLSIQANHIKMADLLVILDIESVIPKEIMHFEVYLTNTGLHNDVSYLDQVQVKEENTLEELKQKITAIPTFQGHKGLDTCRLRVRELKKDFLFGKILRGDKKQLKKLVVDRNTALVVQVLEKPEQLTDHDLVLLVRKRLVESRTYDTHQEIVFRAGNHPTVNELKQAVIDGAGIDVDVEELELAKFFSYDFEWRYISKELAQNPSKGGKKGKTGGAAKQKETRENLKKAPYLLKDGDVIGYRFTFECIEKEDDFQTEEDRLAKESHMREKAEIQRQRDLRGRNAEKNAKQLKIDLDEDTGPNIDIEKKDAEQEQ